MLHRKIIPGYSGNFREPNNKLCMILILIVSLMMTPTATNTFWSSAEQIFVAQQ